MRLILAGAAGAALLTSAALAQEQIGFVTHAQGDPFVQQIIDGAEAAARDLGVELTVAQQAGGAPEGQLRLVQNLANAGAQGIATSVPGESMVGALNDIVAMGVPIVQFNLLSPAVNAPYVGEKSVESGRILGRMIVERLGGAEATGTVIIGNCFPGFPVLENRARGVQESRGGAGRAVLGPYDVRSRRSRTIGRWEQLLAANPDARAMIGLCAPGRDQLGKLNEANGDSSSPEATT
jgi:ABC-type sugar transport system substrate-binding protein